MPDGSPAPRRNDLAIYDDHAQAWWTGERRWLRTLANLVPARLRVFDEVVDDWSDRTVLDLGCGGGFMAEAIARRGAQVTGLDPAAKAIDAARRHARDGGLDIAYEVGVGEDLPFEEGRFDIVVCVDVLEHVEDVARTLAEVRRVLKPGGLFLFDTINRTALAGFVVVFLAESVLRILPRGTHDPDKFIRPAELCSMLESCGFAVGRMTGLGPRGIDRRLDLTFGTVPTTAIVYIGSAGLPTGSATG